MVKSAFAACLGSHLFGTQFCVVPFSVVGLHVDCRDCGVFRAIDVETEGLIISHSTEIDALALVVGIFSLFHLFLL